MASADPLEQIKATFFEECRELLADLESGLMSLEGADGDVDTINAVFRAVHSVKGGAGAFGMEELVRFAHVFETTLDEMRSGRLVVDDAALKVMLRAADMLSDHVAAAQGGGVADLQRSAELSAALSSLTQETSAPAAPAVEAAEDAVDADPFGFTPRKVELVQTSAAGWRVSIRPHAEMYAKANEITALIRELERLGPCAVMLDATDLPSLEEMEAEAAYLEWIVDVTADCSEVALREVFEFVEGDCRVDISPLDASGPQTLPSIDDILASAKTEAAPAPDGEVQAIIDQVVPAIPVQVAPPPPAVARAESAQPPSLGKPDSAHQSTIRVDLERVDRLIDLVGELVINQAMLAQRVGESGFARSSSVMVGLDDLEQLTREIQDSVMAIRAQPVKSVFQRMPRLVREIAATTGKQVRLVTDGEGTEVDKTVIERLTDPITHMIRNAIDHGLETPEQRVLAGKPAEGVVRLTALHRSGRIVLEVGDDGKGIDRARVRQIAINKGLLDPEAVLSDEEVDNLLFLPGFSTASEISNISGRGVGMDVVKRSIQALGGRINIASTPGLGSTFTMSLPLTLAVLDGMVVSVGQQTLVAPLTCIIETLQPKPHEIRTLGIAGRVVAIRDTYVPLVDIGQTLGWRTESANAATGVCLLVESESGGRAALLVDAIQGQRQVVIKSLEANYQQVPGIAAATILGDGRVALILDVDAAIALRPLDSHPNEIALAS